MYAWKVNPSGAERVVGVVSYLGSSGVTDFHVHG